jgi:hypothetical protein
VGRHQEFEREREEGIGVWSKRKEAKKKEDPIRRGV